MTAFFQTLLPLPLYVILFECMLTKQVATKRWNCERFLKAKLLCRTCPWNWRWLSIETRKLFGWRWTWFAGKDLEGTICFFSFDWESSVDWSLIMRGRVWFVNVCGCSTSSMLPSGKRVGITSLIGMISESIDAGQHAAVVTHGHRNGNICLNYLVYSAIVTSFRAGFSHQCLHATKEKKQNFIHTPYTTFSSIIIWQTPFLLLSGGLFLQETSWLYRHGAERSFRGCRWWCVTRALCLWYGLTCGSYLRAVSCFSNMRVGQATPRFGDLLLKIISAK